MTETWVIIMVTLAAYVIANSIKTYGNKVAINLKMAMYFVALVWLLFMTVYYFNDTTDTLKHVLKIVLLVGLGGVIVYKIKKLSNGKKAHE